MKENIKQELFCLGFCLGLPVLFEILYQGFVLQNGFGTFPMVLYAALVGGAVYVITGFLPEIAGKIVYCVVNSFLWLYFMVQAVYYHVFEVFFSFASVFAVGGDVMDFKETIFGAIAEKIGIILLYTLLLISFCIFFCLKCDLDRKSWKQRLLITAAWLLAIPLFYGSLLLGGKGETEPYGLYVEDWNETIGVPKLGILVFAEKDILGLIKGDDMSGELEDIVIVDRPIVHTPVPTNLPEATLTPTNPPATETPVPEVSVTPGPTNTPTPSPSPTPTPIDTSPNILNIDFYALAEAEKNKEIKTLHEYFASEEYTLKNEYTGMFEGYNLIYITAEGFAPYAMQEGLTPTLLKMATEGFVFKNYYAPLWMTSTIDGEFVNCTGLLPDRFYSLRRMIGHDMRFCFGHMFGELGYATNAYHNHSYSYYDRDETHPSMGYTYKGRGNGLNITKQWPGSDLEMMELSLPEYIGNEPFHTYYMTVSGHMEYNFNGNRMAYNNRKVVEELPYSDMAKAYIACNYELEKALTYLVEQLEAAGVAERTVIALATDHYPYGLEKEVIDELEGHEVEEAFELYKSTLIIWSPSMEEPVEVEKYCTAIDIAPTLANLFGLEYDSRLYMGKDILSTAEGLVMFQDKSFITDRVMYNAANGEVTYLTEEELPEDYIKTMKQIVKNRFKISKGIIDLDYYSYLPEGTKASQEDATN